MANKEVTLKNVLNDQEGRAMVDAIEDTLSSIQGKESSPELENILSRQVDELEVKTGYRYRTCLD